MKLIMRVDLSVKRGVTAIILYIAYLLGVGMGVLLGKLLKKSFIVSSFKNSSWFSYQDSHSHQTMY